MIVLCAVLGRVENWAGMEVLAKEKEVDWEWYRGFGANEHCPQPEH
jgi:hypothetical protein